VDVKDDAWDEWLQSSGKYNPKDLRPTWQSFEPAKGVTGGTILEMAQQCGWRPGAHVAIPRPHPKANDRVNGRASVAEYKAAPEQSSPPCWDKTKAALERQGYCEIIA
jgi:Primase C terminal 2 (PriCT-2)